MSVPESARQRDAFTRHGLSAIGFQGFLVFKDIDLTQVPDDPGVYVVLREAAGTPDFLPRSPAGWFKGKDPSVPVAELERAWPVGAQCVYIGKAAAGSRGRRHLRQRITEFRRFGDGEPVGHQGGRRIWQLADADHLVVAWRRTREDEQPEVVEAELIQAFVARHGRLPLGNRTIGRHL